VDENRFDAVARALGATVSRRSGLSVIVSLLGLSAVADEAGARRRKRKPQFEGPCGDGSRKDNICTNDGQCCTGVCDKTLGETNVDGKGRCRCVKRLGKCTTDRNCCGGRACAAGVCGGQVVPPPPPTPLVPLGDPCVAGVSVCADNATCQQQTGGITLLMPNDGYFCSHEIGGSCTVTDEFGATECVGGWCSSAGDVCGEIVFGTANSCAGTSVYLAPPAFICAISAGGRPVYLVPQDPSTSPCSSDADCGVTAACVAVEPGSQCVEWFGVPAGNHCRTGGFGCSVDGDCPVKPSLTATCSGGLCSYS